MRDELQAALGSAYTIERELGGGGMSRVFVANETALHRQVVVKVLTLDPQAAVSLERFRREIAVAARLQHPHIVPLLSAGEMQGVPYYTMPYVSGESLRHRLQQHGEMSVPDVIRVLREVADALAHAHEHGIVHRDVKPENILLTKQHAVVADFGVAKALSASTLGDGARGDHISSVGIALGTPAYMAPEQAAADSAADHRVDIYALGCVGYEMLTGHQVFAGRAVQSLLAAHATEAAEPVGKRRPNIPPVLADLVMRCLEKRPGDRPQSAEEIERTLATLALTPNHGTEAGAGRTSRSKAPLAIAAGVAAIAIAAAVWSTSRRSPASKRVDENVITVAPFRVSADPSLSYLREGMLDLIAANLTGEGGPRATDPRATLVAWRRAGGDRDEVTEERALDLARGLGAGRVLLGSVVGSGSRIVISAVLAGADGTRRSDLRAEGPADSLPRLVDQLTAQILTRQGKLNSSAFASLAGVPLPAVRAYLEGQAAFRRAHYNEATDHFLRALEIDSSFALATLSGTLAASWANRSRVFRAPLARVWKVRDQLNPRDRALAIAEAGRFISFVEPAAISYDGPRGSIAVLASWDSLTRLAPDNADAWHEVADDLFHGGSLVMSADEARARAVAAFGRVLSIDSSYASAYEHLVDAAILDGDTARARWAATKYLSLDSLADHADYIKWRVAHALGDSAAIKANRSRIPAMSFENAQRIFGVSTADGIDAADSRAAVATMTARATRAGQARNAAFNEYSLLANEGRLSEARDQVRRKPDQGPIPPDLAPDLNDVYESLYGDLEVAEGEQGARRTAAWLTAHTKPSDAVGRYGTACALAQWSLAQRDLANAERFRAVMRAHANAADSMGIVGNNSSREPLCLKVIEAWIAVARRQPDARIKLEHADTLLMEAHELADVESPIIVARLWELLGDLPRALTAYKRRTYHYSISPIGAAWIAREEGRLAALAGDRQGAIRAYRKFLAMRPNPEPRFRPEVERVKKEVERLLRETAGK